MRFITIMIIALLGNFLKAQTYSSRNNYTGDWEDAATWNFLWSDPSANIFGTDINIRGHITLHDSLIMQGTSCTLTVYDTLIIYGDLSLGNNVNLIVRTGGILIIRGNLTVVNNTDIFTNGYVIVTGDFINTSSVYGGSFWTTGDSSNVFISGVVPAVDEAFYPVLDCTDPVLDPFAHTGCAYGNSEDLLEDPIYSFYSTTCRTAISSCSNSPLCEGQNLKLSASGGNQFHWNGPGGFTSNIQNPEIHNIPSSRNGKYIVSIISPGCTVTDTVEVIIKNKPNLWATVNNPVCEGQTVIFNSSGANQYSWSGPDSFISNLPAPVRNLAKMSMSGQYLLIGITDDCSDSVTVDLIVNPQPIISASVNSPVCEGQTVHFAVTGAMEYVWSGPGGFLNSGDQPEILHAILSSSGSYVVQGTQLGCTDADTVDLNVNPLPQLSVSAAGPYCEGDNITLNASGDALFRWTGPLGFQSAEQSPVISDAVTQNSGDYFVKATTPQGCTDSAVILVTVNAYPEASAGADIVLENEYQANMDANTSGYETGIWSLVTGSGSFSDAGSPVSLVNGLSEGENLFRWTTSNGTCQASDDALIRVIPLFIPNVITPNSDGKNDYLVITGIGEKIGLLIFNRMGITVYSTDNYSNDWNGVDNSGIELPDDTYYYILSTSNGKNRKGSVLIKRR